MKEVAEMLHFNSRNKLFEFLRRYNILIGSVPAREFQIMGYFDVIQYHIRNKEGKPFKTVPLIRVTESGVKFIKELHKLLTKDLYVSGFNSW